MCCPSDFLEGKRKTITDPSGYQNLNYTSQRYEAGVLTDKPHLNVGLLMDHNSRLSFDDQDLGNISPYQNSVHFCNVTCLVCFTVIYPTSFLKVCRKHNTISLILPTFRIVFLLFCLLY